MRRTLLALAVIAPLFNPGLLDPFGNLLVSIWSASATGDAGCIMDPYGSCRPAAQPQPDAGCELDPYGRCRPVPEPQPNAGCDFDPYGSPCNQGS